MLSKTIISLTLIFILTTTTIAQTNVISTESQPQKNSTKKLTSEEEREAREISAEFTKRLQQTRDLLPIVKEMFLDDFIERQISEMKMRCDGKECSAYFLPMVYFNTKLLSELSHEEWQRFYATSVSLLHFSFLYFLSKKSFEELGNASDVNAEDLFPKRVISIINQNPLLKNFILRQDGRTNINTIEEMRSVISTFEQSLSIMREEFAKNPPEKAKHYQQFIKTFEKADISKPQVEEDYIVEFLGFPKETRIIRVTVPFAFALQLYLVKTDKGMKIALATFPNE